MAMGGLLRNWLVEMYDCRPGAMDDIDDIKAALLQAAAAMGAEVRRVKMAICPTGVHGYVVVSSSHLAVRTWAGVNFALIDVACCGELREHQAWAGLMAFFAPRRTQTIALHGGGDLVRAMRPAGSPAEAVRMIRHDGDVRVYHNGELQFVTSEVDRCVESMVAPALALAEQSGPVLVLGGGFGLLAREVLRFDPQRSVTVVDAAGAVLDMAARHPVLVGLNGDALRDPRVQVVQADAWEFLQRPGPAYAAVIADLPEPTSLDTDRLYSPAFYRLVAGRLLPGGAFVTHGTSPTWNPRTFWTIVAHIRGGGFHVLPYHLDVPSFGDLGLILAAHRPFTLSRLRLPRQTRYLTAGLLRAMTAFGKDCLAVADTVPALPPEPLHRRYLAEETTCPA